MTYRISATVSSVLAGVYIVHVTDGAETTEHQVTAGNAAEAAQNALSEHMVDYPAPDGMRQTSVTIAAGVT